MTTKKKKNSLSAQKKRVRSTAGRSAGLALRLCRQTIAESRKVTTRAIETGRDPFLPDARIQSSAFVRYGITRALGECEVAQDLKKKRNRTLSELRLLLQGCEGYTEALCAQRIEDDDPNDDWGLFWTTLEVPIWESLGGLLAQADELICLALLNEETLKEKKA